MSFFTRRRRSPALAVAALVGLAAVIFISGCVDNGAKPPKTSGYMVTVNSEGADASGGGNYEEGDVVTVTAGTAPDGKRFKNWTVISGGVSLDDSSIETAAFTMPANAVTVAAVFESTMFTDPRDVKTYRTTKIGVKVWMAQNLDFKTENGSWCYENNESNCDIYGRLYNWNTAMSGSTSSAKNPSGVQGVCPDGWHLPSRQEWGELAIAAGGTGTYGADTTGTAGTKLKAQSGWNDYKGNSGNGTDDFGFSALAGGYRDTTGSFLEFGISNSWWTATENNSVAAFRRWVNYRVKYMSENAPTKAAAYQVRCVRDD